jgi:hypothetical protein
MPPPANADHQEYTQESERATRQMEGLDQLEAELLKLVAAVRQELNATLTRSSPAEGLEYLGSIIADPHPDNSSVLDERRVRRILAVRFHAYVYWREPCLGSAVGDRLRHLLQNERDSLVVSEAVAVLGGLPTEPFVYVMDGEPRASFSFSNTSDSSANWSSAIRTFTANDLDIQSDLFAMTGSRYRRFAIPALANLESPDVDAKLWQLGIGDPLMRSLAGEKLIERLRPESANHLREWMLMEEQPDTFMRISRSLTESQHPIPLRTDDVIAIMQKTTNGSDPGTALDRQRSLTNLLGKVWRDSRESSAKVVLLKFMSSEDAFTREQAILTIARWGDESFMADLKRAEAAVEDPYLQDAVHYAMRKLDPKSTVRSLRYEIDQLKAQREDPTLTKSKRRELQALQIQKSRQLAALRKASHQ